TVTLIPNGIHHPPIEDGRLLPNSVKMTLMNDNGDELSVEDTWSYLSDYIVSFEIIEFVADKEE
ncbi:DUF5406 family protein, partial [Enterococcus faecium]|uniref:DUF5406 family protein n=1 Tax=Enterococcus faecium TaxID=1352 RepID=UPI001F504C5A